MKRRVGLIIGVILIVLGASESYMLRGTNSPTALVGIGSIFVIVNIMGIMMDERKKELEKMQQTNSGNATKPKDRINRKDWIYIVLMVVLAVVLCRPVNRVRTEKGDYLVPVQLVENGETYTVQAIEGQVVIMLRQDAPLLLIRDILQDNDAWIISGMSDIRYYLVGVAPGKEEEFITNVRTYPEVDYVYPNAISELLSVQSHALDDFLEGDHGLLVQDMMNENSSDIYVHQHDVGAGGKSVSLSKVDREFWEVLNALENNESAVINMSFGPGLKEMTGLWKEPLWNFFTVTQAYKKDYKLRYVSEMHRLVKIAVRYNDKDFVVTKSSGNVGMKQMEQIIAQLKQTLSSEELNVFERHFILVSAKDDHKGDLGDYPNDVTDGTYDRALTKVDISDRSAHNSHLHGTSFSSPRAANYIIRASNKHDAKVTYVLDVARDVTKAAPDHLLTYELLDKALENASLSTTESSSQFVANSKQVTFDGVLKMYLVDSDLNSRVVSDYRETDGMNNALTFVITLPNKINIVPYLEPGEDDLISSPYQSAVMVLPQFTYSSREFAAQYANKRVRVSGNLYAPGGGWRNSTDVVMQMHSIELLN